MRDYRDRQPPKSLAKEVCVCKLYTSVKVDEIFSQEFSDEYQKLIMDHKTENNLSREDIIATVTGI